MAPDPLFDRLARALAGRYHPVRELGQGGMGTVYLGTDLKLNRTVAIKVLPPTTRAYLGSGRFQREVLLAAQLSHPHIVPLFEADEADDILFYVMEYVEGESLKDRLAREGPLPVDDALAAVLYEMLVGEPPFTGPSVQAIVARVLTEPPRPTRTVRPQVPPHVEHAVASGLAKVPADRPPSARAFVDMLTRTAAGRRWGTRSRWFGATVGALALAGVGIVMRVIGHQPPASASSSGGGALVPGGAYKVGGGSR